MGNLDYIEIKNVPMKRFEGYGDSIHAAVLATIEKNIIKEFVSGRLRIRGQEIEFIRRVFGFSQRDFAKKLKLSHVAILKWEKAKNKPLDLVNEVAVKALISGELALKLPASIESLSGEVDIPKKLVLDYADFSDKKLVA